MPSCFRTFTPVRRLFIKQCAKLPSILGKRCGARKADGYDYGPLDPVVATPPEISGRREAKSGNGRPPGPHDIEEARAHRRPQACIALQTEDTSQDVIVITALDTVPFCCHDDLLAMPRDRLLAVAHMLNTKLPYALWIDAGSDVSDDEIRKAIEILVDIRQDTPAAPKSRRLPPNFYDQRVADHQWNIADDSPLTSPLARRSRTYGVYSPSPTPLARLDEEDETALTDSDRPRKKRRVSAKTIFSENDEDTEKEDDVFATPTPVARIPPKSCLSKRPLRDAVSGAEGLKLTSERNAAKRSRRVVMTKTSSSSSRQNHSFDGAAVTSTPRYNARRKSKTPIRSFDFASFLPPTEPKGEDEQDVRFNREMIFGMDGMRMCESYDGDFDEMDTRVE